MSDFNDLVILFNVHTVINSFKHCKTRTGTSPDNISGRMLIHCAEQLGPLFTHVFDWSLSLQRVLAKWKQATTVPAAKTTCPKTLNDFRPIALTSLVMKSFEKLIKEEVVIRTEHLFDPLQFAYRTKGGVRDATLTLLTYIYCHLQGSNSHGRLLFVYFSSAFNTIQPHLLVQKLTDQFFLDNSIVDWMPDFLTCVTQRVRVNDELSDLSVTSTGSPQGCVLSPLLYIMYTNDCRSTYVNCHILKFADSMVTASLLNKDEFSHGPVVDDFMTWRQDSFLVVNVSKTKDMPIDFDSPILLQSAL